MAPDNRTAHTAISIILFLVLAGSLLILTVAARDDMSMQISPGYSLNSTNHSITTDRQTGDFVAGPTPVTILRVELNQSTLPGPRDMGFGPSIIDLSIPPLLLAMIFMLILMGIVIRVIWTHKKGLIPADPKLKK